MSITSRPSQVSGSPVHSIMSSKRKLNKRGGTRQRRRRVVIYDSSLSEQSPPPSSLLLSSSKDKEGEEEDDEPDDGKETKDDDDDDNENAREEEEEGEDSKEEKKRMSEWDRSQDDDDDTSYPCTVIASVGPREEDDAEVEATASKKKKTKKFGNRGEFEAAPFSSGLVFKHPLSMTPREAMARQTLEVFAKQKSMDGYVLVNRDQMERCWKLIQLDPFVRKAVEYVFNHLITGDLVFERAGSSSNGDKEHAKWMSATWSKLVRDIYQSIWAYGFVAISYLPHHLYGAFPYVLNLTLVDVYSRSNYRGQTVFVCVERDEGMLGQSSMGTDPISATIASTLRSSGKRGGGRGPGRIRIIPSIMTICQNAPDRFGNVMSKAMTTIENTRFIEMRKGFQLMAERGRAAPTVMYEEADSRPQPYEARASFRESTGDAQRDKERKQYAEEQVFNEISRTHSASLAEGFRVYMETTSTNPSTSSRKSETDGSSIGARVLVPSGKVFKPGPLPEPPAAALTADILMHSEMVSSLFGVPPSLLQTETTSGRSATSSTAMIAFQNTIRSLRQEVVPYLTDVYHWLYDTINIGKEFESIDGDKPTPDRLRASTKIDIKMPGIPPGEVLSELYQEGILKIEPYIRILAANHSMSREDFNRFPTPPKTEYIPPATSTAKPKAKAKKKKKKPTKKKT